ncbi:uncharacterized protein LOC126825220, partial [Patella vulgata]|uniref:uncharacterized protein LOC126825220 n=1 Tax=Patella vulgata TaxID=6465 RepID=UPI0024A84CBF
NRFKDSALHLAVRFKNVKVVTLLVSSGIDVNLTNKKGETALDIATTLLNAAIFGVLKELLGSDNVNPVWQKCMEYFAPHRDIKSATKLIQQDTPMIAASLLEYAYRKQDMAMVDTLIDAGLNQNYKPTRFKVDTFLHKCMEYSVSYCDIKSVTKLIQHGTPVKPSLLSDAYCNGDLVMVDTLIQAGLHQNHDQTRFTAFIYYSVSYRDTERVKKYIKYASPFGALEDGRSLLDVAYHAENYDMAGILLQNGHELTFGNCLRALNLHLNQYNRFKHSIVIIKHVIQYGIAHMYRWRTQFMPPKIRLEYDVDLCVFENINILYLLYMSNLIKNHELHHRLSQLSIAFNYHVIVNKLQNMASDRAPYLSPSLKALQELASSPMPLVCITRNVICESLGPPNMWFNVGLLPLPDKLKSFLRYEDILHENFVQIQFLCHNIKWNSTRNCRCLRFRTCLTCSHRFGSLRELCDGIC